MKFLLALCTLVLALHKVVAASDEFLIQCAEANPNCAQIMHDQAPSVFDVRIATTRGNFTVHVNTSWAPPMAQRFYTLSKLAYFNGGPLYRVLNVNASERFVAQFGYRAVPSVDAAWLTLQMNNSTPAVMPPGNVAATIVFGTSEIPNEHNNPNCTADICSVGFSVELFINMANNTRLDASDFPPFGWIDENDLVSVIDTAHAGYGECADMCAQPGVGSTDPYCVWDGARQEWAGVNLTRMLLEGKPYLQTSFPLLDYVLDTQLL